jgi:hypothetical protein
MQFIYIYVHSLINIMDDSSIWSIERVIYYAWFDLDRTPTDGMSRIVKTSLRRVFFLSKLLGVFPLGKDLKYSWPWLLYSFAIHSWVVYQFYQLSLMIHIPENVQYTAMTALTLFSPCRILTKSGRLRLCLARWMRTGKELHKIGVINSYDNKSNFIDQFVGILTLALYLILYIRFAYEWEVPYNMSVFGFTSLATILINNQITSLLRYLLADFRRLNVHLAQRRPQTILSLVRAHESLTNVSRLINDVFSWQLLLITTAIFSVKLKLMYISSFYFNNGKFTTGCICLYCYLMQYYEINRLVSLTSSISNKVRLSQILYSEITIIIDDGIIEIYI